MMPSLCAKLATHINRINFFFLILFLILALALNLAIILNLNFSFSLSFSSGFSLIFCINLLQNQQEPSSHQRLVLIIKNA